MVAMKKVAMKKVAKTAEKVEKVAENTPKVAEKKAEKKVEVVEEKKVEAAPAKAYESNAVAASCAAKVDEACASLKKFNEKKNGENPFEADASAFTAVFNIGTIAKRATHKPHQIELPFSPLSDSAEICVFVKDDFSDNKKQSWEEKTKFWKNLVGNACSGSDEKSLGQVKKIIPLQKLKKNYKSFQQKRELLHSFDLFLCDKSLIEMMPGVLGKAFYQSKSKAPVPVTITQTKPVEDIIAAVKCACLRIPTGPCVGVKVGDISMDGEKLAENVKTVIAAADAIFEKEKSVIHSVALRYTDSPSLEVYRREIDAEEHKHYTENNMYKLAKRAREEESDKEEEESDSESEEEEKKPKVLALFKGAKEEKKAAVVPAGAAPMKKKAKVSAK